MTAKKPFLYNGEYLYDREPTPKVGNNLFQINDPNIFTPNEKCTAVESADTSTEML